MSDVFQYRCKKVEKLKEKGVYPYGYAYRRTGIIKEYIENFSEGKRVRVAGRIITWRAHGKAIFADIKDGSGKIQVYGKKDILGEESFLFFKELDIGDIIGVEGELFKTRTGEPTILVKGCELLAKALLPLPEKWHGLKDIETRYRQRYLDLIANPAVKDVFVKRSSIISYIRRYLDEKGFMEVETPMMQPIPGGAAARPFVTHHIALDIDLYLRIAPELYLKRLLVGGFEKVYELNRNFRNEGISRFHNPEFTMLEVYAAYEDYLYMKRLVEELIPVLVEELNGKMEVDFLDGKNLDFSLPWESLPYYEAIRKYSGMDVREKDTETIIRGLQIEMTPPYRKIDVVEEVFKRYVEPNLIKPVFIVDFPVELSPLAKAKRDDPSLVERFELYINGQEIANAYSELNDPVEQRRRFVEQLKDNSADIKRLDEDFLNCLEYGMPPAGGLGIGIDRLVMMLTGMPSIRDVILFPQLRPLSQ